MFTLGVTLLWSYTRVGHGTELGIAPFALTGYTSVLLWRNPVNRAINAIETNNALRYHRNVRVFDIVAARSLLEIVGVLGSFGFLVLALIAFDMTRAPVEVDRLCVALVMQSLLGVALSLFVSAMAQMSEFTERIWHVVTYLLFPLSGTVFMVEWLPAPMRSALTWVPVVHGSEAIRHGFFGAVVKTHEDWSYQSSCILVLLGAGLFGLRHVGRSLEVE